ncbi:hypothetical protein J6T66_01990 [bacterium]|nr:hypothetical protein [bacterium]
MIAAIANNEHPPVGTAQITAATHHAIAHIIFNVLVFNRRHRRLYRSSFECALFEFSISLQKLDRSHHGKLASIKKSKLVINHFIAFSCSVIMFDLHENRSSNHFFNCTKSLWRSHSFFKLVAVSDAFNLNSFISSSVSPLLPFVFKLS